MSSESSSIFSRKTFCVVTGAGRGFGKCITERFAKQFQSSSIFLLLARDVDSMQKVRSSICTACPSLRVIVKQFDQSRVDDGLMKDFFSKVLSENSCNSADFDQACIVHNSGVTGDLTKYAWEMTADTVRASMEVNLTGMILLNAEFLKTFREVVKSTVVINVSTLAAVKPFKSWSLYCSGKAGRDMYFQVLAKEDPNLRVLNYAPGPLDTDMQNECRECKDPALRKAFQEMKAEGRLLSCDTSVDKLIKLLTHNTFENGAHIDFYDIE